MDGSITSFSSFDSKKQYNKIERAYVHVKVNRARWVPVPDGQSASQLVTGSYSELNNSLDLWTCPRGKHDEGAPRAVCTVQVSGDVTELKFVDPQTFLASTGKGDLLLFKVKEEQLEEIQKWDTTQMLCDADSFTGFDVADGVVALATTDGQIVCFPYADSSNAPSNMIKPGKDGVKAVSFIRHHEIALGNLRGQISIWDLRENIFAPAITFPYNADSAIGVTRLSPFPLQKHILVASGCDGTIATWDLRNVTNSQTIYAAHSKLVSDLRFHDMRPGNLFTCSFAGDVWHWNNFDELLGASTSTSQSFSVGAQKPNVLCLLPEKKFPVNSIDVCGDTLVSACDNDLLVFIKSLKLK
uniref:Uncharacterized protein n=1 Tax=Lygus hesperus TaxID=30085 RepID=A0A0K8SK71_LYGHE